MARGMMAAGFALAGAMPLAASAVEGDSGRLWTLQPYVSLREIVTNNYNLSGAGGKDAITEATGSLKLAGRGTGLRGFLEYKLTALAYAKHHELNTTAQSLQAAASTELVEDRAYLEARASMVEQAVSSFGTISLDASRVKTNHNRVTTLSLMPWVKGRLGSTAEYTARVTQTLERVDRAGLADTNRTGAELNLFGALGERISWDLAALYGKTDYRNQPSLDEKSFRGTLGYLAGSEVRVSANVGVESGPLDDKEDVRRTSGGLRVDWAPSDRTRMQATYDRRYYGNSHAFSIYRVTERTIVYFSDTRERVNSSVQGLADYGTLYQAIARQVQSTGISTSDDELRVREYLRQLGIDPDTQVVSGFVASTPTIARSQILTLSWQGLRVGTTLRLVQSRSRRLTQFSGDIGDFSLSDEIRQRGLLADASYRLSPISSIGLSLAYQGAFGTNAAKTELRSVGLQWSRRPSNVSQFAAGARFSDFDSAVSPYRETLVFASYSMQF